MKNTLFKLETNNHFKYLNISKIKKNEIKKILIEYNLCIKNKKILIFQIKKKNEDSRIYQININKKKLMLIEQKKVSKYLEKLIRFSSEQKINFIPRYFLSNNNTYLIHKYGNYFYLYEKIEGNIFKKNTDKIENIYYQACKLIKVYKKLTYPFYKFKIKKMNLDIIVKKIKSKKFNEKLFRKKVISKKTILMSRNIDKLVNNNFLNFYKKYKNVKKNRSICHNDLNHSNIIINKKKIFFIDITSVNYYDFRISLSHLLFKLSRHCVFLSLNKDKTLNHVINIIKNILQNNNNVMNYDEFILFNKLRIISDINLILKNKKYMYDYEKKIHNLFEIEKYSTK